MRLCLAAVLALGLASTAGAEIRDEEHLIGDRMVRISVVDTFEIMTVGPSDYDQMQVLSGADVELLPIAGDEDGAALIGQPVLVAEVTGTHSCDEGDARAFWVVTLGDVPTPEGPLTTCVPMAAAVSDSGQLLLTGTGESWVWVPGQGWSAATD